MHYGRVQAQLLGCNHGQRISAYLGKVLANNTHDVQSYKSFVLRVPH